MAIGSIPKWEQCLIRSCARHESVHWVMLKDYVLDSRDESPKFHFTVKPARGEFRPWEEVASFGYFEGAPTGGLSNPCNVDYYKATWVATVRKTDVDKLFAWAKVHDYRLILR